MTPECVHRLIKIDQWTVISTEVIQHANRSGNYTEIHLKQTDHHRKYGLFESIWDEDAVIWEQIVQATGSRV